MLCRLIAHSAVVRLAGIAPTIGLIGQAEHDGRGRPRHRRLPDDLVCFLSRIADRALSARGDQAGRLEPDRLLDGSSTRRMSRLRSRGTFGTFPEDLSGLSRKPCQSQSSVAGAALAPDACRQRFNVLEISEVVEVRDHVLGDAAVSDVRATELTSYGVDARQRVG